MAFLNNSGDIIVDAVLTDIGREKLSKGQPIVSHFGLGDGEIDYALFNPTNPSGSAYYDLDILQTPIFEPVTYSQASMQNRLFTYPDPNLNFLPVFKINQNVNAPEVITVDSNTKAINVLGSLGMINFLTPDIVNGSRSYIDGRIVDTSPIAQSARGFLTNAVTSRHISIDQGFDNPSAPSLGDLEEVNFSIYVNRLFFELTDVKYQHSKNPAIVTVGYSQQQATDVYKLSSKDPRDQDFFGSIKSYDVGTGVTSLATDLRANLPNQIATKELQFSLRISKFVAANPQFYFTKYGQVFSGNIDGFGAVSPSDNVFVISTYVRVVGSNYGFATELPVKLFYKP